MGSSLNLGPVQGLFYKGAVLYWGPKKGPEFRELPIYITIMESGPKRPCLLWPKYPLLRTMTAPLKGTSGIRLLRFRALSFGFRI